MPGTASNTPSGNMGRAIAFSAALALLAPAGGAEGAEIADERFTITYDGVSAERIAAFHREAREAFAALTAYLDVHFEGRIHIQIGGRGRAPTVDAQSALIRISADRFHGLAPGPSGTIGRVPAIVHDIADVILPSRNHDWGGLLQYGLGVFLQERFGGGARAYPAMGREIHRTTAELIVDFEGFVRLQDSARLLERLQFGRAHRVTMMHQASFVKHLVERRGGLEPFLRVHQGQSLKRVYGADLCGLEAEWIAYLVERFPETAQFAQTREGCTEF